MADFAADLPALHDALDGAALAVFEAEGGDRKRMSFLLMEASAAAASAFPAGSREADALEVILGAISHAVPDPAIEDPQLYEPELGD